MLSTARPSLTKARAIGFIALGAALFAFGSPAVALALGAAFAWTFGTPGLARVRATGKRLLPLCVIGLGAGMDLTVVARAGLSTFIPTAISISICFGVGLLIAKRFGLGQELTTLISAGTAICGGSAIAAVSGSIAPKEENVSVALATVFVLNGVALFAFPALGHALDLSPGAFGAFAALAIHDTSSVVGAAASYDEGGIALTVATSTKLARALWIVPVTMILGALAKRKNGANGPSARPWFILWFVGVAALCTFTPVGGWVGAEVSTIAKRGLALVLFVVGAQLSPATLRLAGARAIGFGTTLWGVMTVVSLALVIAFGLGT